ncbi:MAG: hypothetical protein COX07_08935 [Bacteroidetes bacterium CG23_combo_of_CG06-09_8_20_14_all_32_9]|nr:MAG: hypothetical protein COX07_08935 [Bacteroidetes bacterium CG23_combo_of_CG06-09_8_20_14_all_32_9]
MKKFTVILAVVLFSTTLFAQEKKDTTTFKVGKTTFIIISENDDVIKIENGDTIDVSDENDSCKKNKFNGHWGGFDIGLNGFLNNNNSFSLDSSDQYLNLNQAKSWHFSLNFAEFNIGLVKKYVGLVSGLGLQFNNYRFDKNISLIGDSAKLTYYNDAVLKFQKNKMIVTYLTIPLLLEFNIPVNEGKDNVHFSAGVIGGLRIGTHIKQVFEINGNTSKEKVREDFHLSPITYALTGRLGYNGVSVFVNYNLSSLLKSGEGPEVYPWSAGLSFTF